MEIGQIWKGWTVDSLLGEGSFGKVYKIVRKEFGYTYESALKVILIPQTQAEVSTIRSEGMDDNSITSYYYSFVQDIASEFALMSQLRGNSNIVSYEDHTVTKLDNSFGWEICLQMELLTPMNEYLQTHTFTERDVALLGIDICKALEICEKKRIIHRDIKPDNIFYSEQGSFKIGDFGIARQMDKMTSVMSKKGTYAYMAPEVYKGKKYDQTVDIYSLGLVLYRYLNNTRGPFQPPYPEPILYSDNEKANAMRMVGELFPAPCNASKPFTDIILRACSYDPKQRYADARDMRKAIESILEGCDDASQVIPKKTEDNTEVLSTETSAAETDDNKTSLMLWSDSVQQDEESVNEQESEKPEETQVKDEHPNTETFPEEKDESVEISSSTSNAGKKRILIIATAAVIICILAFFIFSYLNHKVPDVTGKSGVEAEQLITDAGLKYKEEGHEFSDNIPRGSVISQSKEENSTVKRGTEIAVVISKGKAIKVPDLTGKTVTEVKKELNKKGLNVKTEKKEYSDTVKKGCVISQDPQSGTECEQDDVVVIVESKGIEKVKVPDVAGKTEKQAKEALKKAGLEPETTSQSSSTVSAGNIISQYPEPGSKIEKKSKVTIVVSSGAAPVRRSTAARKSGSGSRKKTSSKKSRKRPPVGKVGK